MQTHECWSSPMWSHQVQSLATQRWEIELPPEPIDRSVSLAAANARKAELSRAVHDKAFRFLRSGPASAEFVARHIKRDLGWTRKILREMETAGKITYAKQGHKKVWRIV